VKTKSLFFHALVVRKEEVDGYIRRNQKEDLAEEKDKEREREMKSEGSKRAKMGLKGIYVGRRRRSERG
jgi:hypothetical protein